VDNDTLARAFGALADPTRLSIVARLAAEDATVKELTESSVLTQQAVSRHLKVLEESGLVTRHAVAQTRPASLEVDRLIEILQWVDDRRREWTDRQARLGQHLADLQQGQEQG
jgi:DNA-binding transcriptional ArsR family regulator